MSYLDALRKQSSNPGPSPRQRVPGLEYEDVETDIGQSTRDSKKHEEMMKMFNEMPKEVQLRIRTKVEQRRKKLQEPFDKKVAANELRNKNQEKLKSNLEYRNEVRRKAEIDKQTKADVKFRNAQIKEQKKKQDAIMKEEKKSADTFRKANLKLRTELETFDTEKKLLDLKVAQAKQKYLRENAVIDRTTGEYQKESIAEAERQGDNLIKEHNVRRAAKLRKYFLQAMNDYNGDSNAVMDLFDKYGLKEELLRMLPKK